MIYANHAGTSWPKPAEVQAAAAEALAADPSTAEAQLERDHRAIAAAFGLNEEEERRLLLTPGATSALSVGLDDWPWQRGDRLLISSMEHHALHRPALMLAKRGVEVGVVPRSEREPLDLDALETELRRGGVRWIAMTAASNVTGERLPVEKIVERAHTHGARVLIDGAQLAGWVSIDLPSSGIDRFVFAGHKGPQAPWGVGGLYVAADQDMPGFCDVGSVDRAATAGLAAGLRWLAEPSRENRLRSAQVRIQRIRSALDDFSSVSVYGAADPETRMPTLAFTVEGRTPGELAASLRARGIVASGGLQCAPAAHRTLATFPDGVLRISIGPETGDDDVASIIAALREMLER